MGVGVALIFGAAAGFGHVILRGALRWLREYRLYRLEEDERGRAVKARIGYRT